MKVLCGLLERLVAPSCIVLVDNDKLCVNTMHRETAGTGVAAYGDVLICICIEIQYTSIGRNASDE